MKTVLYTSTGNKSSKSLDLKSEVFDVEPKNTDLIKKSYLAYLANARTNSAKTKNRSAVRGGGKKPWKQKGLGRARAGSIRSPLWAGGGIIFGPTGNENYEIKISTSAKRVALKQALSLANKAGKVQFIEAFDTKSSKTSNVAKLLNKLSLEGQGLLVAVNKDENLVLSTRNLKGVKLTKPQYLNVYDLLNADYILIDKPSSDVINDWLSENKESKK
jgi:large subunit ribosomal protein L4